MARHFSLIIALLLLTCNLPTSALAGEVSLWESRLPQLERENIIVLRRDGTVVKLLSQLRPTSSRLVSSRVIDASANTFADTSGRQYVATLQGSKPVNAAESDNPQPSRTSSRVDPLALAAPGTVVAPGARVLKQWQAPFDLRTGALHGVRSKNGFSAERAAVSIPCGASHMLALPGTNPITQAPGLVDKETGYIYIGGWGAGAAGTPVDAGLQKSSAQSEADDYAVYWKYDGNPPITFSSRFACGSAKVTLALYPMSRRVLHFSATGIDRQGKAVAFTILQMTDDGDGWWPSGGSTDDGVILKRMVTIAQPPSWHIRSSPSFRQDAWHHKAWFGVAEDDFRPLITWSDCVIGTSDATAVPNFRPWTAAQTWTSESAILDYPFGAVQRADAPMYCDVAGIDLDKTRF